MFLQKVVLIKGIGTRGWGGVCETGFVTNNNCLDFKIRVRIWYFCVSGFKESDESGILGRSL